MDARADFGEHGKDGKGLRMRELRATSSGVSTYIPATVPLFK